MMLRLNDVNWNQFYYFYEVARRSSMKGAAAYLHVSVPTISEHIKRLEERLDVLLFRREARCLELTPDGEKLFQFAREMFAVGNRLVDAVSPDAVGGYAARVGIQETMLLLATNFVADYWDCFAPYGTVNTVRELFFERVVERLLQNELDWAIVMTPPKVARLDYREIGCFEIAFCCSEAIYARFKRPEDIVRTLPLARNSWDLVLNKLVQQHLSDAGIKPKEAIESDHRDLCLSLARRGRCVATFSPETLAQNKLGAGLRSFRVGEPIFVKHYAMWSRSSAKMIAIRKLLELLDSPPAGPRDPNLQLQVSDVPSEWLIDPTP